MRTVIRVENASKIYRIYHNGKEKYLDFFLPIKFGEDFYAIKDVNVSVKEGSALALVGLNGSGKSTLAKMIAGGVSPTSGRIRTSGKVSMSSISAGINMRLTGLENIQLKCLMLGLSHNEIKQLTP